MASKYIIRVSEFQKLYYDSEGKLPFRKRHWTALCAYLDKVNKTEAKRKDYYRILNKGIQFTNFVGVIQAGDLTIEVLPKIDRGATGVANKTIGDLEKEDETTAADKAMWHNALLQMLKECKLIRVNHVDYANLKLKSNSILDIYLELFLLQTEQLMHQGLIKKYNKREGNKTALKGQLQFQKQATINCTHQERFFVRFTEYDRDNIFNQLIYKTLCLIPCISSHVFFSDFTARLLMDFPEVSACAATEATFDNLKFDRKTEPYWEVMLISKMLLLNYRPDITGGRENVIAILFDMNKLWEEFIYRRLKKEEVNYDMKVSAQGSKEFWKAANSNTPKKIRPDIMIEYPAAEPKNKEDNSEKKTVIIIDTKWKHNEELNPADDDLKQMFVYNLYWNCEKSILLYPSANEGLSSLSGQYEAHCGSNFSRGCTLKIVSIFKNIKLDSDLGVKIISAIPELNTRKSAAIQLF